MRKLISKAEEEKKKKRNQLVVGVVLIFVMFFSVIGYSFGNQTGGTAVVNYNGFKFIQESGGWGVDVGNLHFTFRNNPNQVEKISSSFNLLNSYQGKPLYFYSENNNEAEGEIYKNLFSQNQIVQRVQLACLTGEKCVGDYPIKTCDDNFIIIKESDISGVRQDKNCVFIEGKTENLVKLSDSFLFKIIGIQ